MKSLSPFSRCTGWKRFSIFALLLFCVPLALAGSITGRVVDASTGEPLPGANVTLEGTTYGAATDPDGRFTIANVPAGEYTVIARYVGFERYTEVVTLGEDALMGDNEVELTIRLEPAVLAGEEIQVVADRALERQTPVAFTNVEKAEIERSLGSRDLPTVLNTTPGVYATEQGGGAGDARINVRGFNQRNVAVMINGVPVNDMENGWVYWSNWDGLGDATSSIQVQRGLGASNLAVPSVGGTINILTDAAELEPAISVKQEVGSGSFFKTTLSGSTGRILNDKLALSFTGVRKLGNGIIDQTWTNAWSYFGALSYQVSQNNRIQAFVVGAPQTHGQRLYQQPLANFGSEAVDALDVNGIDPVNVGQYGLQYNPNWGPIDAPAEALQEYYWGGTHDPHESDVLMERENYYHKPQANLNWYFTPNDRLFISNVVYVSWGRGGGSGVLGDYPSRFSEGPFAGQLDFQSVYETNSTNIDSSYSLTETASTSILRNSVNQHNWYGIISAADYKLTDQIQTKVGIDARYYKGEHYREVRNLIGGNYFLDFSNNNQDSPVKQLGDKVAYHNDGLVRWYGGFAQVEGDFDRVTATVSASLSNTDYKRVDYFLPEVNGEPAETAWESFIGYKLAGGLNYNLTDAFNVFGNAGYISKPPQFDGVFNFVNELQPVIENESVRAFELGVGYRTGTVAANLNLYSTMWADQVRQTRITRGNDTFNATYLGIDALHQGIELDVRYKPTPFADINAAVSLGNWRYTDNTQVNYSPEDNPEDEVVFTVYAEDLKVGDAAQTQFALSGTLYPADGLFIGATAKNFQDYYAEFDPARRTESGNPQPYQTPGYTLLDLHMGYTLPMQLGGNVTVELLGHIFNALDATYITDATNGPDNDAVSGEYFLGLPRRFNAGLKATF